MSNTLATAMALTARVNVFNRDRYGFNGSSRCGDADDLSQSSPGTMRFLLVALRHLTFDNANLPATSVRALVADADHDL
jgi:hypothetical protein